jgi:hypothetical protein
MLVTTEVLTRLPNNFIARDSDCVWQKFLHCQQLTTHCLLIFHPFFASKAPIGTLLLIVETFFRCKNIAHPQLQIFFISCVSCICHAFSQRRRYSNSCVNTCFKISIPFRKLEKSLKTSQLILSILILQEAAKSQMKPTIVDSFNSNLSPHVNALAPE